MIHSPNRLPFYACLIFFIALFVACNGQQETKKTIPETDTSGKKEYSIRGYFNNEEEIKTDSGLLKSFFTSHPLLNSYAEDVIVFMDTGILNMPGTRMRNYPSRHIISTII